MSIKKKMYHASFRGVNFMTSGAIETAGGRKIVDHDYVNSDRKYIEDMGKLRKEFSIDGYISDNDNKYIDDRNNLIEALEKPGSGDFVHPFLGKFKAIARPYVLEETTGDIGMAKFTLKFAEVDKNIYPDAADINIFGILLDALKTALLNWFGGAWILSAIQNIKSAVGMITDVINTIKKVVSYIVAVKTAIQAVVKSIAKIRRKINSLVMDAVGLATQVIDAFENIKALCTNPLAAISAFKKLFGFSASPKMVYSIVKVFGISKKSDPQRTSVPISSTDKKIKIYPLTLVKRGDKIKQVNKQSLQPTTQARIENLRNANTLNIFINTLALGYAYEAASQVTFENQEQIEEIAKILNDQYESVSQYIDDPDVLKAISDMRDAFRSYQEEQITSVDKIISLYVENEPLTEICYRLYGSTANYDKLIALNSIINPANINGTIKVLSE